MEHFNYLMVIVSVILGLGITHLLTGLVDYVQHRERLRWSFTQLTWMAVLFLLQVQYWHATWEFRSLGADFSRYLVALAYPSLLFIASGILVPKVPESGDVDLRELYFANHRWFFGTCVLALLTLVFYDQLVWGKPWSGVRQQLTNPWNQFRLIGLGLVLLLALSGSRFLHRSLTFGAVLVLTVFLFRHQFGLDKLNLFG